MNTSAVASLEDLQGIADELSERGYNVRFVAGADTLSVAMSKGANPILATITIVDGSVYFACQLATLADLGSEADTVAKNAVGLLAKNADCNPFAVAVLLGDSEDTASSSPVVLQNSVPVGDFSPDELAHQMEALQRSLQTVGPFLAACLKS